MSQDSIVIAATNQIQMIDDALIRRFDLSLKLDFPQSEQIKRLVDKTINGQFTFDNPLLKDTIIEKCHNISYYVIKRTLLNTIKRTILDGYTDNVIQTKIWSQLISNLP
jgi:SpoVK/Ycf46/Vps4 family AAA+-type ATPase